jgi:hypothetical protein
VSGITAPRPMRKSWCIGKEERPTKTDISTMTFSICDAGVSL